MQPGNPTMRFVSLVPALFLGVAASAGVSVDLSQIGHIQSKGRVQDQQSNKVVNALVAAGPDAIPFLVSKLVDETEVTYGVLDLWPHVRVGDVALIVLIHLFTAPDNMQPTIPGLSWDSVLDRSDREVPASVLLEEFLATHGRKGLQLKVEKLLNPHSGRLVWDSSGQCFRPVGNAPPNNPIKLSVRPVTHLAVASCAPVQPAAYRVRYTD